MPTQWQLTEDDGALFTELPTSEQLKVGVRREVVAFLSDLMSTTRADHASGTIGFNLSVPYPAGSVGAAVRALLGSGGGASPEVAALIVNLAGLLGPSTLTTTLRNRIDLIDTGDGNLVSRVGSLEATYGSTTGAAASATAAALSQVAAATAEINAAASRDAAAVSAGLSLTRANASESSRIAAETAAGAASVSASSSASSATSSAGSAATATTQAGLAATSASNAGTSASAAANSVTTAQSAATDASNSATAANSSRLAAQSSAGSASVSATSAAGSATTAGTSAGNAATSASNAGTSASSASLSASLAATSATNATNSATAAATSLAGAVTYASDAGSSAAAANSSAVTAQTAASAAAVSSGSAATSATAANGSASAAASYYNSTVAATGTLTASVNELSTAVAGPGGLSAQYVLKTTATRTDGKKVFAAIGLAAEAVGATGESQILFQADRLVFVPSNDLNATPKNAFVVGSVNGVTTLIVAAAMIGDNVILPRSISTPNLSALSADLGTVTAGTITLNSNGFLRGGQTDFDTGFGYFLGRSPALNDYAFSLKCDNGATFKMSKTGGIIISGANVVTAAGAVNDFGTVSVLSQGSTGIIRCGVKLASDGRILEKYSNGGAYDYYGNNWHPTTTGIGASFWARVTSLGPDALSSGTVGTWQQISGEPTFELARSTSGISMASLSVKISTASTGVPIVGNGLFSFEVERL